MSFSSLWLFKLIIKWVIIPLGIFGIVSIILYFITEPQKDRNWTSEHALMPEVVIKNNNESSQVTLKNVRDFQWFSEKKEHYKEVKFQLENIVGLKAVVSHFAPISEIAHVFIIFVLDDGREFGVSIEARREKGENFSLHGGLFARFELIYLLATPEDLLGVRRKNNETIHVYPIKVTVEKAQELFLLISSEVNTLIEKPALYHLFFKNCTNQLVKNVSILTEEKYPWYFQTLAPGKTGEMLYQLGLIDFSDMKFEDIQAKTLVK